jgi:hypothetical protein
MKDTRECVLSLLIFLMKSGTANDRYAKMGHSKLIVQALVEIPGLRESFTVPLSLGFASYTLSYGGQKLKPASV